MEDTDKGLNASGHSSVSSATGERRLSDKSAKILDASTSDNSSERPDRRVSFRMNDKAARLLGMESADILGALPRTSEHSEASGTPNGSALRRARFGSNATAGTADSFGTDHGDDDGSVVTFDGGTEEVAKKKGLFSKKKTRKVASKIMQSMLRKSAADGSSNSRDPPNRADTAPAAVHFSIETESNSLSASATSNLRGKVTRGLSGKWGHHGNQQARNNSFTKSDSDYASQKSDGDANNVLRSKSVSARRDNLDVKALTMGLDLESAKFLDWMTQAKCEEWLRSLCRRDPRACIKAFFDDVARDGADSIEQENGFQPELLSPLLSMFQRSSVFSVWRPTSVDAIQKMMTGQGTGKGLDIKGKSAKKGKLSAYVPFLQIHEDEHKKKIRSLTRDGRIRIFYKKREARDKAHKILSEVMGDMTAKSNLALMSLLQSDKVSNDALAQDECSVVRVLSSFRTLGVKGEISDDEQAKLRIVNEWAMDKPSIIVIDDYSPKCFGLDIPKRLFWEGYVMRAKDISREPGSVYDTGRPSRASFQDMNFASIKNEREGDSPRAVVWQYTDPYLPPTEPDPDPMMSQTLLMAYEEHGRVMPVVSDFDCFLLGTRGVRFHNPLPEDQVELVHNMISDLEKILQDCRDGKSKNWTASWLHVMKHQKKHITMPKYGFGDPKSYAIMKYAVQRLEEFGAVRHGAECFNFYFPQELDDEFLVIGGNLGGAKYKYMKLNELQDFLFGTIDLGFTFPLNPKWVLCDEGWKAIWDKLTGSVHPNVQLSINAWYPPGSGLKERIEDIHKQYPEGFQSDLSGRKKGTQAWDEAEIALDRYQRIQRAKRKLWIIMSWISIVQKSRKTIQARQDGSEAESSADGGENEGPSNGKKRDLEINKNPAEKRVSFQDLAHPLSLTSQTTNGSNEVINPPTEDAIAQMGKMNCTTLVRARTADDGPPEFNERFRRSSSLLSDTEENIDVIDSLMSSNLCMSEYQIGGLQRIREQLSNKSISFQPRINNRFERRHTSIDGRMTAMMLEDVPSFILKEYGGVKGDSSISFQDKVKKIMTAQRFIGAAKCGEWSNGGSDHFLPVEWTTMSKESKQRLAKKLSFASLSRWDYNMIEVGKLCNGSPLLFVGWAIMGSPHAQQAMASDLGQDVDIQTDGYNFITEFCVQMPILCSFLRTVEADYLPNPYHNNIHAADVVQTLNTMLQLGGKEYASSPLDLFSILVAAVIHDVKHPGLNNNFQVNSRSELAVQYNDVSVLENYSIMWLFAKLLGQTRDFTVDIFSGLSKEQFSKARSIIIRSVLETDMTHHFALLKKMGIHQEMLKGKDKEEWLRSYTNEGVNYDPSMDMLCFLLHQADISNPAKPYPLFVEWADHILAESFAQGDKEAALSLPVSPLCDRVSTDKKQCQIGFIKFVVQPSYQLLGEIIPLFAKTVFPHIEKSLEFWDKFNCDLPSFEPVAEDSSSV
mmetsp:Transcript_11094/g.24444  ORF Transcript_11094/g.24444 Transcript_11094/m.24444 type:complete len:1454 (-) Transcript_11094:1412-5773(-)|eukprot:CAMPEP_0172314734 /NCGR_PEP_ID=MMETSP1058-20130122/23277_1 /TAXON_ID=83371 /ORGANISM="Detonula confervacea, Strain CCMP 353" /LENGTH=1453 /DNA_ID=CAMNT_0013028675 /DNA_START=204 /DNA_END=4565 /DNA_ORIENTATION=+